METRVRILAAALLTVLAAASAFAQDGAKVAAAERETAAAYAALRGRLTGAAQRHVTQDQARWLADRRGCDFNAARAAGCLEARYQARTAKLKLFGDGPYPFISEQAIVRSGKLKHGTYAIDASYPQFDAPSANFTDANRGFADPARETIDQLVESEFDVSYDQNFELYRLNPHVFSVWVHNELWDARVTIWNTGTLVDLHTGKVIPPEDVFTPGEGWRARFLELVDAEVTKDFLDMGRGPKPADLAGIIERLRPTDYLFEDDKLVLYLGEIALSLGMKGYAVEIPYAVLKPLLRADGPLGGR
jgi:hypothetical protein